MNRRCFNAMAAAAGLSQMKSQVGPPNMKTPETRNGVYTFHHYHSTADEVLGFAKGQARLVLGGEQREEILVHAGDVALLPTGTGHCELESSDDFMVIGAHPPDQTFDICRSARTREMAQRMARLPFPQTDPVYGHGGPLGTLWPRT